MPDYSLVPLYSPLSESESSVISSLLEAHQIPFFIRGAGLSKLYPGVQINHFNDQTIMVQEADFELARELIAEFLVPVAPSEDGANTTWVERVRIVIEAILFGWFVPGRRGKTNKDESS